METKGNPIRDLNPEQLLGFVAELMGEHRKKTDIRGHLVYYKNELKIVISADVPTSCQIIKTFSDNQLTNGLCTASWNNLRETLTELQHEVLCNSLESKLLPFRKRKSCSSS